MSNPIGVGRFTVTDSIGLENGEETAAFAVAGTITGYNSQCGNNRFVSSSS
jgi:hypothetical protein